MKSWVRIRSVGIFGFQVGKMGGQVGILESQVGKITIQVGIEKIWEFILELH
ncbi:hypothetical protein [Paenisporosarcina sp. TG20]|uniref:hypothetical protein n=1 Tax=Paenisporosarcina sp. TG20 TaxID=1211706 RepID=UPI0002EB56D1|nr:hypothetical protein [Paenisporosarcina sp. TG20]